MQYFAYSQKAFIYKYVVMLSDTDQFRHTSFANYLKLMFLSTDALFVSLYEDKFLSKYRIYVKESRMQFKRQTISGDNVLVKINSSEITPQAFSLLYTFIMEGSGELVGLGRQTYQLSENETNNLQNIPDYILNLVQPILVDEKYLLYKY